MTENLFTFSTLEIILSGITGGLFLIQILFYLVVYARPLRVAKRAGQIQATVNGSSLPPVSVIVYTRGEAEILQKNLPAILTQDYPDYEVIVVNDGSDMDSEDVLKIFSSEYKHLYYTFVPVDTQYLSHKKLALTMGIKAAKHDILLFTEADCRPVSSKWIATMTRNYTPETEIRLGFCAYNYNTGLLHKLIAYDNLLNGLQYLSSALARRPYSGNGRNMSYRRKLFFDHKGYSKSLNIHAGADDLFINEAANRTNTAVEYSADSIMEMDKIEEYIIWREMRVARLVTQHYYEGCRLAFFRMDSFCCLLFLIAAVATIITGISENWLVAATAGLFLILRFTVKATIFHRSSLLLHQKPATAWLPLLELIQPAYNAYIRIYRIFRGKNDYTSRI
ncbi:glycosyltransferase [Parabacteroides sp. AM08-6]|uniref:glycosyltransferase n=1 Tax=Parabacteroides sp. AM08-6 TaxID=2292053 RepID=UPI000EFDE1C5|nr:glycosyltransferase [Parabacteroides sp. AM08-6]RHJ86716.1 glycosyltransferase [Parabacteroides sp. AM08-6]